jgi:hypothetical protein
VAAFEARSRLETESRIVEATPNKISAAMPEPNKSQLTPKANAKQPFVDEGPSLPETYNVDIIRAIAQDPFRVFVYWEISDQSITALTQYFSAKDDGTFQLALKLIEDDGRVPSLVDVERQGSYWMNVSPSRDYEFELEAYGARHEVIPLLRSNRVHTPSAHVSRVISNEAEYRSSSCDFAELLRASGLDERAFESELSTGHAATSSQAEEFTRLVVLAPSSYSSSAREK